MHAFEFGRLPAVDLKDDSIRPVEPSFVISTEEDGTSVPSALMAVTSISATSSGPKTLPRHRRHL
jgi:hypothetical protein